MSISIMTEIPRVNVEGITQERRSGVCNRPKTGEVNFSRFFQALFNGQKTSEINKSTGLFESNSVNKKQKAYEEAKQLIDTLKPYYKEIEQYACELMKLELELVGAKINNPAKLPDIYAKRKTIGSKLTQKIHTLKYSIAIKVKTEKNGYAHIVGRDVQGSTNMLEVACHEVVNKCINKDLPMNMKSFGHLYDNSANSIERFESHLKLSKDWYKEADF